MDEIGLEAQNKNAAKNEPCLWKRLWETCVRPARLDAILHIGNQVSVKTAARKAYDILRHYLSSASPPLRLPPEEVEKGDIEAAFGIIQALMGHRRTYEIR